MAALPNLYVEYRREPERDILARLAGYNPKTQLGKLVKEAFAYLPVDMAAELVDAVARSVIVESALALNVIRHPDNGYRTPRSREAGQALDNLINLHSIRNLALAGNDIALANGLVSHITALSRVCGLLEERGVVGNKVVTTAGVVYIAARMANGTPSNISLFNYHGLGTTNTAEAVGDTALAAEITTAYNPDNTRATGTQSTPGSTNIYQTQATNTVDGSAAVVEHGVFTQAATGGGTLLDRTVFSTVNLASGDSLQSTYQLTLTAGG